MDSNDNTKASNLEWQNFPTGTITNNSAIAPSLSSSSSSLSSFPSSTLGPSTTPFTNTTTNNANTTPLPLPQGFLAWLTPSYYRALFDIDTNDVITRLKLALFPFQFSSTISTNTTALSSSNQSFITLVQHHPDWYGTVWCTLTLVAVIASGSQLAAWLNFRPELSSTTNVESGTTAALTVPVWRFDVTALSSSLMVSYAFAFWAPLIIRAAMAYLRIMTNIITFPVLVCIWGYGIAPYIVAAVCT